MTVPTHLIYHYCERLGPGFWAEPLNAITNAVFLIAAGVLSWRLRRTCQALRKVTDIVVLIGLLCTIAIGSFLWHTLAKPWAQWADIIPILIYISLYLLSYLARIARVKPLTVLGLFLLYHALNISLQLLIPPQTLNGSMFYLPTLVTLLLMGVYSIRIRHPAARRILMAGVMFSVSLVFRTLDFTLCPVWPFGTHFIWHILNAYVLYALTLSLLVLSPVPVRK